MRIVKNSKINNCIDLETNGILDTVCEEVSTYTVCRELLSQAIDVLSNDAATNDMAKDILIDLSVVLLELDGLK